MITRMTLFIVQKIIKFGSKESQGSRQLIKKLIRTNKINPSAD